MRKLAHIEKVIEIREIPKADRIEMVKVLGWECVAKKGEFKLGDLVVYIEIDSLVPDKPEYEFLRSKKFKVKTIKLRGQISQGLILPLSNLYGGDKLIQKHWKEGDDVTSDLGIIKYISTSEQKEIDVENLRIANQKNMLKKYMMRYSWFRKLFLSRTSKEGFPRWIQKTDENRIQNMPHVLDQFAGAFVYITEKIDYQSGTWFSKKVSSWYGSKTIFGVCSRRLQVFDKSSLYWKIAEKYNLEKICKKYPNIIIQGEQGSSKVQGNKYGLKEPRMFVFNIIMPDGKFLTPKEIDSFCNIYDLESVPNLGVHEVKQIGLTVGEWIKFAEGKSLMNPKIEREGIVIRHIKNGQKLLSFKVINNKFLLKNDE
jgi:hypothetical protein